MEDLRDKLEKDIEEYHRLVRGDMLCFSWKIFADFLITKGYGLKCDLECYSCGNSIKNDGDRPECYCNDCVPEDNPNILRGDELKRTVEARKRGQ